MQRNTFQIERILVAMDASPYSRVALKVAADLAASLGAEIRGVFVEDTTLLGLADLPMVSEVHIPSARVRSISSRTLEQEFRALAREAEGWMATMAQQLGLSWEFELLRGNIVSELLSVARSSDLISLGRFGWPIANPPRRMGSIARALVEQCAVPALLLHQEIQAGQPILAVFRGIESDGDVLQWTGFLAQHYQSEATIFLMTEQASLAERLGEEARALLAPWSVPVRFQPVADEAALLQAIHALPASQESILLSRRYRPIYEKLLCGLLLFP